MEVTTSGPDAENPSDPEDENPGLKESPPKGSNLSS